MKELREVFDKCVKKVMGDSVTINFDTVPKVSEAILALPEMQRILMRSEASVIMLRDLKLILSGPNRLMVKEKRKSKWKDLITEQHFMDCPCCNGIGTITRTATAEEVREMIEYFFMNGNHEIHRMFFIDGVWAFKLSTGAILFMEENR